MAAAQLPGPLRIGYADRGAPLLANIAIYWFTGTAGSAMRLYWEDAHATEQPTGPTTVPTALAMFPGDFQSIRRFADRDHGNIVSWHAFDAGPERRGDVAGHYAAHEATDVLVGDIRQFFARLR